MIPDQQPPYLSPRILRQLETVSLQLKSVRQNFLFGKSRKP
jgi:hypothetical protein